MNKLNKILAVVIILSVGFVVYRGYKEGVFTKKTVTEKIDGKIPEEVYVYENKISKYKVTIPGNWGVEEAVSDNLFESRAKFTPPDGNLKVTKIEVEVLRPEAVAADFSTSKDFEKWEKLEKGRVVSGITKVGEASVGEEKVLLLADLTKSGDATDSGWLLMGWFRRNQRNFYVKMTGREKMEETDEQVFRYLLGTFEME